MVLGLVMVAGVVGTCPRNGRAATDEMVAVLKGVIMLAAMNNRRIFRKQVAWRDREEEETKSFATTFTTRELTHGGR